MKKNFPAILLIIFFILLKASNIGVRLSDTNIYFDLARRILEGKLIYKDLFFSNFPLFAYVSSFYYLLTFKNIILFYFTSIIEISIISLLIYCIAYKKTGNRIVSTISIALYLFSFIILSTSDHQAGVFTASLLSVSSYFFLQKRKYFVSGVLVALTVLTKAYFLPIALSFFCYFLIKKEWRNLTHFIMGAGSTTLAILLPFLILSPKQFINDIFGFSLTRPAGTLKAEVAWFFITKDILFFILLLFNLISYRKNIFFALISLFSILLFLGYQDVYYLYLNFLIPFLCISFYELSDFIKRLFSPQKMVIPTIVITLLIFNFFTYIGGYKNLGKIDKIDKVVSVINNEKPSFLYGATDITPALLAITKIQALSDVVAAHEYFFTKKIYNKELITKQALSSNTIILTHGAYYPESNIRQDILDDTIINKEEIYRHCKNILSVPVLAEGNANSINLFKCY